jgi:hypothetical protein
MKRKKSRVDWSKSACCGAPVRKHAGLPICSACRRFLGFAPTYEDVTLRPRTSRDSIPEEEPKTTDFHKFPRGNRTQPLRFK